MDWLWNYSNILVKNQKRDKIQQNPYSFSSLFPNDRVNCDEDENISFHSFSEDASSEELFKDESLADANITDFNSSNIDSKIDRGIRRNQLKISSDSFNSDSEDELKFLQTSDVLTLSDSNELQDKNVALLTLPSVKGKTLIIKDEPPEFMREDCDILHQVSQVTLQISLHCLYGK